MHLINIKLKNFKAHKDLDIPVAPGIIGIMGHNGAGKSSLLEGIFFGLTGKTLNGEARGDLKTWGSGKEDGFVEIIFADKDNTYTLNRSISKNNAYIINNTTSEKIIGITEVSDFLNTHIGLEYDLLRQVLFVGQEQLDTPLKGTESSRKDAFGKLFGCDELERLRDIANSYCSEIPVNKLLNQEAVDLLQTQINEAISAIKESDIELANIENEKTKLPNAIQLGELLNKPKKSELEKNLDSYTRLLTEQLNIVETQYAKVDNVDKEQIIAKKNDALSKMNSLLKGKCPTCGTVLKTFNFTKDDMQKVIYECDQILQIFDVAEEAMQKAERLNAHIEHISESLKTAVSEEVLTGAKEQYNRLEYLKSLEVVALAKKRSSETLLSTYQKKLDDLKEKLSINNKMIAFIDIVTKIRNAFHRDAIQKDLRTFGADSINACLGECLSVFNVPYDVYFTTDGLVKFKDKNKEEHDFSALSGGQKKLVSLAYRLALMKLFSRNINICVLDEPTSFIDTSNIEAMKSAFTSLSEFAHQNNMAIFIATHEYSLVPIFSHLIELGHK